MIKIIIAERHTTGHGRINKLLDKCTDMTVVAEVDGRMQVTELINGGQEVDVILADLNIPLMDGIRLIRRLKRMAGNIKVIILTTLYNEKHMVSAFEASARGYLLKDVTEDELIFAIKSVYDGKRYICSKLALRILNDRLSSAAPSKERKYVDFTRRELEVLENIAAGYTNIQIGERLSLNRRTIEVFRRKILFKTDTRNTAMLVRFAYINNYIH